MVMFIDVTFPVLMWKMGCHRRGPRVLSAVRAVVWSTKTYHNGVNRFFTGQTVTLNFLQSLGLEIHR